MSDDDCSFSGGPDNLLGLRIGSVFIILANSTAGALFPVLARRTSWLNVPKAAYEYTSFIPIATAFIHLLSSGLDELGSQCLGTDSGWTIYAMLLTPLPIQPYALALCMLSIFVIFIVELVAFRWGMAKLEKLGIAYDPHGHDIGSHAAHGPEPNEVVSHEVSAQEKAHSQGDVESQDYGGVTVDNAAAQIIGVAILEFGIILHSVLIGLTLATDQQFKILFIVIIFHQTFEGLGVGSRLAYMKLHPKYDWTRIVGALLYGITTPVGIVAGLGVRSSYDANSTTALIVSGVLDSLSSGILIYTGLVELIAHEFLFSKEMITASNFKLTYNIGCMFAGWALMSLLGRWA
ncbi:hypothetical protein C0995_004180 [Termitomyces sp. Mi166|nr:hypothetical protein C0995_004180 [Termitomyces sp. Mi166\